MIEPRPEFALTDSERDSPLWERLMEYANTRLEKAREKNDASTLTADQTAAIRGEIADLKRWIALGSKRPKVGQ